MPRITSGAPGAQPPPPPHRLSLLRIEESARVIDPVFLHSPQLEFDTLSATLGCRLTIKVETLNPVRSFKGRGADYLVTGLAQAGRHEPLVCASAGNFGQAMAYACRKHGIALTVFASIHANALKVERMRSLGAQVLHVGEDFDAAKVAARAWADEHRLTFIEDGAHAAVAEGAGSIAVELLQHAARIDALVLPLGNGALLTGMARWVKANSPDTRIIGVCSRGAPAMADSWRAGAHANPVEYPAVQTIADGIAVRVPIAEAVADLHGLMDNALLVTDRAILRAMRLVHEHAGLVLEPAGAVGVAALLMNRDAFAGLSVATVFSGSGVTRQQIQDYFVPPAVADAHATPVMHCESAAQVAAP